MAGRHYDPYLPSIRIENLSPKTPRDDLRSNFSRFSTIADAHLRREKRDAIVRNGGTLHDRRLLHCDMLHDCYDGTVHDHRLTHCDMLHDCYDGTVHDHRLTHCDMIHDCYDGTVHDHRLTHCDMLHDCYDGTLHDHRLTHCDMIHDYSQKQFRITFKKYLNEFRVIESVLFTKLMHNKFLHTIKLCLCDLSAMTSKKFSVKYFFACTISKLAQFTPLASSNISSKRELLITSANFLALYYASILWYCPVKAGEKSPVNWICYI